MSFFRDLSIRTKLILLAGASVSLGLLLACIGLVTNDVKTIRAAKVEQLAAQARMLAFNSTGVLTFHDKVAAEQLLASLHSQPSVEVACLIGTDGAVLAMYDKDNSNGIVRPGAIQKGHRITDAGHVEIFQPVIDETDEMEEVGTLYLRANMDDVYSHLPQYAKIVVLVMLCSLLASVAASAWLQRGISRPVLKLAETAERITSAEDYSIRIERSSADELGTLYTAFNRMLNQIESSERELKATQADLVRARDAAEATDRAKSEFLANMSHEIRTPLTGILGFAEILMTDNGQSNETERNDHLRSIFSSGRHLLNLINDILDLSKIEAGRMEFECVECQPHRIMAEAVSVLRPKAHEKGLTLSCRCDGQVPETIRTDPARLRQLLLNLAGNAIKFADHGSVEIVVRLLQTGDKPQLMISIMDTGPGIAPEKVEAIFDPFVQADSSVTRRFGGTGLGLAISRRITAGLGGSLSVQSELGRGSTFTATIDTGPLTGIRLLDGFSAEGVMHHEEHADDSEVSLSDAEILLVEDGEDNQKLISLVLRRAGATVSTASNGATGVEQATSHNFDLILMDMQMPVLDGYAAARILRERGVAVPIIALTAHAMKGDEEKCRAAGCSGYLTKPIAVNLLVQAVSRALTQAGRAQPGRTSPDPDPPPSAPESPPSELPAHCEPLVSSLSAEDPELCDLVEEFVERLPDQLDAMLHAWTTGDLSQLARLAHQLKGSGGSMGFAAFTLPAKRLETLAKDGQLDQIEDALEEIANLIARIAAAPGQPVTPHAPHTPIVDHSRRESQPA